MPHLNTEKYCCILLKILLYSTSDSIHKAHFITLNQKGITFHMRFVIWPQPDVWLIKQPSRKKTLGTLV